MTLRKQLFNILVITSALVMAPCFATDNSNTKAHELAEQIADFEKKMREFLLPYHDVEVSNTEFDPLTKTVTMQKKLHGTVEIGNTLTKLIDLPQIEIIKIYLFKKFNPSLTCKPEGGCIPVRFLNRKKEDWSTFQFVGFEDRIPFVIPGYLPVTVVENFNDLRFGYGTKVLNLSPTLDEDARFTFISEAFGAFTMSEPDQETIKKLLAGLGSTESKQESKEDGKSDKA